MGITYFCSHNIILFSIHYNKTLKKFILYIIYLLKIQKKLFVSIIIQLKLNFDTFLFSILHLYLLRQPFYPTTCTYCAYLREVFDLLVLNVTNEIKANTLSATAYVL